MRRVIYYGRIVKRGGVIVEWSVDPAQPAERWTH